jgi:RNA polymerase sigma factor (sigma-70 family)
MDDRDDNALLREYLERDSEEAFAALVARHVNKVYSVALRHTANPHSAEEITQAVFVILAGKARRLRPGVILSGWLYHTARLASVTHVRGEIRRARRELEAHLQTELNQNDPGTWAQIAPLLDAAMARLGETDRHAIVLRYFDGKSMKEVGALLGASEDAAKVRVNRALEKMRRFLARRGVLVRSPVLAGAMFGHAVQSAPAALAKGATALALAKGSAVSASTLTLMKGTLKIMAYKKTAVIIAGIVVALTIGVVVVSVPVVRTAVKNLPEKVADHMPGHEKKAALVRQMQAMKMSVWPAIMRYSRTHNGDFPTKMDELRPYLPSGLSTMDDDHWRITAGDTGAKPRTPELLTFCEQINQPAGQSRIVLYADGHVEYRK